MMTLMGWDSSRPVPWQRLIREWLIYAGIMLVISVIVFDSTRRTGMFIGVLLSGPMYLAFGAVLAKFGYQRKTMRELRAQSAARGSDESSSSGSRSGRSSASGARSRPAPTKRTSTGPNRPRKSRR